MKKVLPIIFLLAFTLKAFAQYADWRIIASSNKVSKVYTYKNSVTYVLYETNGIGVFDHGSGSFKHHTKYNSSLPSNRILDIVVTSDSVIYLASADRGLIRSNGDDWEALYTNELTTSATVTCVAEAPNGDIWFSLIGASVYRITSSGLDLYGSGQHGLLGGLSTIRFLDDEHFWGTGSWGIAEFVDGEWSIHQPLTFASYDKIATAQDGTVWVTSSQGLLQYAYNTWTLIEGPTAFRSVFAELYLGNYDFPTVKAGMNWYTYNWVMESWEDADVTPNASSYRSFMLNNHNDMWVITDDRYILETSSGNFVFPAPSGYDFTGEVTAFLEDTKGDLWIGTRNNGLIRFHKGDTIVYDHSGGFSDNQVYCIFEDDNGTIWIGGPNRQYYLMGDRFVELATSESINYVYDMIAGKNNSIWMAAYDGLYQVGNGMLLKSYTTANSDIPAGNLKKIVADKNGNLLIASGSGLIFWDGDNTFSLSTTDNSALGSNDVLALAQDAFGNVWIGTNNEGRGSLSLWDGVHLKTFYLDLVDKNFIVEHIAIDRFGNKWLSSQYHGLCRFDGDEPHYFGPHDSGLSSINIFNLFYKKNGSLLIATKDMIISYDDPTTYFENYSVEGVLYLDENNDGKKDAGEPLLSNTPISIADGHIVFTDDLGRFFIDLNEGDHVLKVRSQQGNTTTSELMVTVKKEEKEYIEIPVPKGQSLYAVKVSMVGQPPLCHSKVKHHLMVRNEGNEHINAILRLVCKATTQEHTPSPTGLSSDTITWTFNGMAPGALQRISYSVELPGEGDKLTMIAMVYYYDTQGNLKGQDKDTLQPDIRCTFGQHTKITIPAGVDDEKLLLKTAPVDFFIGFKNTGKDTAYTITVTDTLSRLLDPLSFRMVGSSHPVSATLRNDLLTFIFRDVNLPGSGSALSDGFIQFSITPKTQPEEKSQLHNKAYIRYDHDPRFATNVTSNTLVTKIPGIVTSSIDALDIRNGLSLYPNPVQDKLLVTLHGPLMRTYAIFNMSGLKIDERAVEANEAVVDTSDLPKGIYLMRIETPDGHISAKFIK